MSTLPPAVFITGASSGIGKEAAFLFAQRGFRIALSYCTNESGAQTAAKRCSDLGAPETVVVPLDLTRDTSIHRAAATLAHRFGTIAVLLNNAGISIRRPLVDQSFQEIEMQVRTNLEGVIKLTKEFLPLVTDCIINIASGAGERGFASLSTYSATKFGIRGFTQALANEIHHLRIVSVSPDATATRVHNFARGRPPQEVAKIILLTAEGYFGLQSGDNVNVWEVIE